MKNTSRFPWRRFHGVCSILIILYPGVSVTSPVPEAAMTCNEGEFLCVGDKTCISAKWVCDNSPDCFDVSDEKDCEKEGAGAGAEPPPPPCEDDQFRCHSDRVCIDAAWVCDGGIDCNDKSDELNCTEAVQCTDNQFRCKMTGHCIQTEYICDGTSDCIDNSDEDGCSEPTPSNPTTAVSQSTTTPDLDFLDLEKLKINPQKFSAVEFDFGENFALPENFTYHDTSSDSEIPDKPLLITINFTDIISVNNVTLTNETTEITPVPDNFTRDHVTESIGIIDDLTNNTLDEFDSNFELSTNISFNLNDNSSSLFINEIDDDRSFLEEFFETSTQDLSTTQTSDFVTISETSTMTSFGTFTETPITDTTITDTTITDTTITDTTITDTTIETIATTSPILDTTESTFPSTDTSLITTTIPTTTTTISTTTTTTTTTTPTTTTQSTTTTTTTTTPSTTTTRRTTTPYPCAYNQFYCRADLNCIPVEWRCDHTEDCWDGSDEIHCDQVSVYCPYEDMINCQDTGQCIYLAWICDGHNDCDTGSDEFNCPSKD